MSCWRFLHASLLVWTCNDENQFDWCVVAAMQSTHLQGVMVTQVTICTEGCHASFVRKNAAAWAGVIWDSSGHPYGSNFARWRVSTSLVRANMVHHVALDWDGDTSALQLDWSFPAYDRPLVCLSTNPRAQDVSRGRIRFRPSGGNTEDRDDSCCLTCISYTL